VTTTPSENGSGNGGLGFGFIVASVPPPLTLPFGGIDTHHTMNAIGVIAPYKYEGTWVFDDPAVGLVREPFVSGIDMMIDRLVASIPDAERGFRLLFSSSPFPGHTVKLEWLREEYGGNWYYSPQFDMEGWLCPALFRYFDTAPRELYGRAEPRKGEQ
jgi:hypothetical protein